MLWKIRTLQIPIDSIDRFYDRKNLIFLKKMAFVKLNIEIYLEV